MYLVLRKKGWVDDRIVHSSFNQGTLVWQTGNFFPHFWVMFSQLEDNTLLNTFVTFWLGLGNKITCLGRNQTEYENKIWNSYVNIYQMYSLYYDTPPFWLHWCQFYPSHASAFTICRSWIFLQHKYSSLLLAWTKVLCESFLGWRQSLFITNHHLVSTLVCNLVVIWNFAAIFP